MLIRNATLPDGRECDIRIEGESIVDVEASLPSEAREGFIDATGLRLLPGAIDVHVHFREPGFSHKETWETGSAAAAAGGVTTVVDQPNTEPPTIDGDGFDRKADCAEASVIDYGINGGVSPDWRPDELFERPLFALGEVFLADSTGDMGITREQFEEAVAKAADAGYVVTVHAEDATQFDETVRDRDDPAAWSAFRTPEAEIAAVETVIDVAESYDATIHLAHTSTPEAIDLVEETDLSCEVAPHHCLLSTADLDELGTLGRMNPPLRDPDRQEAVLDRVRNGSVDMIATDHAPHTREEKDAAIWDAPSGVPGVETMVPLLGGLAERGELTYERIADLTARGPAERFAIANKGDIAPGMDADITLIDPDPRPIKGESLKTECGWTPFEGSEGTFPVLTLVRGRIVYEDGRVGEPLGRNVRSE